MTNNKNATMSEEEKHNHHIEGGYKATLSNPNSSEEAKKHAQEMLDKIAKGEKVEAANPPRGDMSEADKHRHHVEGGYKATLNNSNASKEAKKHAQEMLDKLAKGEEISEEDKLKSNNYAAQYSEEEKHQHHVEGGYKATLNNPKSSEEAKKHAQKMLDKLAKGEELSEEDRLTSSNYAAQYTEEEKHNHHVAGGYKATLKNPNSSEEAKKQAREKLEEMGEKYDENDESEKSDKQGHKRSAEKESSKKESSKKESSPKKSKKDPSEYTEEEKHNHHVAGGYKATLKNANSSEEAKKHAREKLEEMGAEYQSEEESDSKEKSDKSDKSDKGNKRSAEESNESGKGKQGFASMPKEKVQEIASKGGRTAHAGEEPAPKKGKSDEKSEGKESSHKKAKKDPSEYTEEEKHNHHVAGGYKATLKNANSSEEAKKHAREKLEEMGADYQSEEESEKSDKSDKKESDKKESDKEEKGKSGKGKQGFASMPKEKVQEIASKGGRTKHAGEEPTSVKQQ